MRDGIGSAWEKQEQHRSLTGNPLEERLFGEMKSYEVDDDGDDYDKSYKMSGTMLLLIP
jgi:hypothetical protein